MKEFAPFVTEDGWKEIDPATTYLDHNLRDVGVLNVGDRIVRLSGVLAEVGAGLALGSAHAHNEIRTEPFLVERIEGSADDPELVVYNLLLEGNHTYFANDLLVHNK